MILPTKGISTETALLTVGARILDLLREPKTVSRVWDELSRAAVVQPTITYDWFVLALDMLYAMGLLELERGRLRRCSVAEGAL
jgi:DNA-binding transcriptional ArsR family regulator